MNENENENETSGWYMNQIGAIPFACFYAYDFVYDAIEI